MTSVSLRERRWLVAALVAAHLVLVLRQYPPSLALTGDVPMRGDASRYFATAWAASRVGGLYGYDPDVMAGYPVGLWNSMGKKGFELAFQALPFLRPEAVFYGTLVTVASLAPLLLWIGLRRVLDGRTAREALLAVAVVYWHLGTQTSYFWHQGNVFFPAMACLVPVAAALLDDVLRARQPVARGVLFGVLAATMFYCHTVILVAALFPWTWILVMRRDALRTGAVRAGLAVAVAVTVALCAAWLVPLLHTASDCVPQPHPWLQSSWKSLVMDFFTDRSYRHHFDRTCLFRLALLGGLAGAVAAGRSRPLLGVLSAGAAACLVVAYGASYMGRLSAIQPYRFTIPAEILSLPPLAWGLATAYERLKLSVADRWIVLAVVLMLLPTLNGYALDLVCEKPMSGISGTYREICARLGSRTAGGRVLCDDMNLAHVIPYAGSRPVLGGLSAQAFTRHRQAGFDNDGRLFGRRAAEWDAAALRDACSRYAVAEAVLVHPEWVRFAASHPELFEPLETVGGYFLYRVVGSDPSWLAEGRARVEPEPGGIRIREVTESPLTLKFHYAGWLAATDGVALEPVPSAAGDVPFIRAIVPAGVTEFRIGRRN